MQKQLIYIVLFLISFTGVAQQIKTKDTIKETDVTYSLRGQIVGNLDKKPLGGANLFNLSTPTSSVVFV